MKEVLDAIDKALERRGLSDAAASRLAVGNSSLIKNLRNPRSSERRHPFENLQRLADVLGLELYFGEPRASGKMTLGWKPPIPHHGFAKCGVHGWGKDQPDLPALPAPDFMNDPSAFYVTASGSSMKPEGIDAGDYCLVSPVQDIREGDRIWIQDKSGATSIKRLGEMTGDRLKLRGWLPVEGGTQKSFDEERFSNYVAKAHPVVAVFRGKPGSDHSEFIPDPRHISFPFSPHSAAGDYGVIALHDEQVAAGPDRMSWNEKVISSLAFPTSWLKANGISPDMASLIYVDGTSMEPTLKDGSIVMINHNRTTLRGRRMYAFSQGGELRVKRLETLPGGDILVLSDNAEFSSEVIRGEDGHDVKVIGEVVWTAGMIASKGV
jgi:phage repressor protein C with HTH and peptisase S24 domain